MLLTRLTLKLIDETAAGGCVEMFIAHSLEQIATFNLSDVPASPPSYGEAPESPLTNFNHWHLGCFVRFLCVFTTFTGAD